MHPLLRQQILQHLATDGTVPAELQAFISAVDDAYRQASCERRKKHKDAARRRKLREAENGVQRAISVVGHELRSPICAMRGMTELLLMTPPELLPSQGAMFLPQMLKELAFMSDLVNDLLENARLKSGAARWNWGRLRPVDVVEEAMRPFRLATDSRILQHSDTTDAPATMLGDAGAIRRLISNLVANAQRHTESGGISVRVAACLEPEWIALVITDTGSGIIPETLARLGQPFATNTGLTRAEGGGTGLGLSICKGIVAAHGGRMFVESEVDHGTTVRVLLRCDLPAAAGSPDAETLVTRSISPRPPLQPLAA